MNIVIIVHSLTGNTLYVAEKISHKLSEAGHTVKIQRIESVNNEDKTQPNPNLIHLKEIPDISTYDVVILGGPVRAFSISPVLAAFLLHTKTLQGKKVVCFVTQFFPFPWMGGNQAIKQMVSYCKSKGGAILGLGVINWKWIRRENKINELVESISRLL